MKTLEQLNEKLNGKIWEKGDKKRIYLDRGHNTKKMKTSTYVEVCRESFVVKCFITCPSQDWNWIKSQQDQVIERVYDEIANALSETYYYVVDGNDNPIDDCRRVKEVGDMYIGGGIYTSKYSAKRFIKDEYLDDCSIFEISRRKFEVLELEFTSNSRG